MRTAWKCLGIVLTTTFLGASPPVRPSDAGVTTKAAATAAASLTRHDPCGACNEGTYSNGNTSHVFYGSCDNVMPEFGEFCAYCDDPGCDTIASGPCWECGAATVMAAREAIRREDIAGLERLVAKTDEVAFDQANRRLVFRPCGGNPQRTLQLSPDIAKRLAGLVKQANHVV